MKTRRPIFDGRPSMLVLAGIGAVALVSIGVSAFDRPVSVAEVFEASSASEPVSLVVALIDLNTAGRDELMLLPGIGPAMADRIFEDRAANGRFHEIGDLARVHGIGPRTIESIEAYLTVR